MTESSRSGSSLAWGPGDRLAVCYGTRPQVIKASVLTETLARRWPLLTIDTGQHFDDQLQRVFYTQLGVPEPEYCLEVRAANPAQQVADILTRASQIFARERPWAVVVLGDTNSTLGCAMAAAQMRIPVVHVEAGLRVGDPLMIEEINRRVVDAIGALLCAPSVAAADRLRSERVAGTVVHTGDVARDVLERFSARAAPVASFDWWPVSPTEPFVFATLHRAELMNDPSVLRGVLAGLGEHGLPVVLPAHPRLRTALASVAIGSIPPTIQIVESAWLLRGTGLHERGAGRRNRLRRDPARGVLAWYALCYGQGRDRVDGNCRARRQHRGLAKVGCPLAATRPGPTGPDVHCAADLGSKRVWCWRRRRANRRRDPDIRDPAMRMAT